MLIDKNTAKEMNGKRSHDVLEYYRAGPAPCSALGKSGFSTGVLPQSLACFKRRRMTYEGLKKFGFEIWRAISDAVRRGVGGGVLLVV